MVAEEKTIIIVWFVCKGKLLSLGERHHPVGENKLMVG